jgi:hypothetical protein
MGALVLLLLAHGSLLPQRAVASVEASTGAPAIGGFRAMRKGPFMIIRPCCAKRRFERDAIWTGGPTTRRAPG